MLYLPDYKLPKDEMERSKILQEYFTEQTVSSRLISDQWVIDLKFPDFIDFYIDPGLMDGLLWWGSDLKLSDIPFACRRERRYQISLNDSWTLFSWSQWLSKYVEKNGPLHEVVILHVDDHDDLMSPRITFEDSVYRNLISSQELDLLKPSSVKQGISNGAIGIGSFIAPLVHKVPKVHIRHLCATKYSVIRKGIYRLQAAYESEDFIVPTKNRLAVKLFPGSELASTNQSNYRVTANLDEWLYDLPKDVPILLHIDMDYFNNRFNGDSDWELHENRHDPSENELLLNIDLMFDSLVRKKILEKICDTTIALSPRFFPAEFWECSIEQICNYLDYGV
jgi:hypothetical protein